MKYTCSHIRVSHIFAWISLGLKAASSINLFAFPPIYFQLLDDNQELFIPETQEMVKAHPKFMLFATQNPPGHYGGRKVGTVTWPRPTSGSCFCHPVPTRTLGTLWWSLGKELQCDEGPPYVLVFATQYLLGLYGGCQVKHCSVTKAHLRVLFLPPRTRWDTGTLWWSLDNCNVIKAHLRFLPHSTHWDTGTLLWVLGKELHCDKGLPQGLVFAVVQLLVRNCNVMKAHLRVLFLPPSTHWDTMMVVR